MLKKFLKKKLGNKYYYFRLKFILKFIFGKYFFHARDKYKNFISKFRFIKKNLDKKIEHQKIVEKENGIILDFTKDNFLTYHLRPIEYNNFKLESTCEIKDKLAIIFQGPINKNYKFLLNTLKIYKKIFKNSIFIISTWKNEDIQKIEKLKSDNVFIVYNEEPKKSLYNIDHQTFSTFNGLKLALEKNFKYSIKTRADIRIHKNNLETFLISLIETFPIKKNNFLNSRIVVPSLTTFKYRLYGLSDIVMFGETKDLMSYFDPESYEKGLSKFDIKKNSHLINQTPIVAEVFLCARFIMKINGKIEWKLDEWWNSLKDYFCVVDNSSFDLFWYKYDWDYEYRYLRTYADKFSRSLDFQDWLSLYNNHKNNWEIASSEHEKYNEYKQLINLFKD